MIYRTEVLKTVGADGSVCCHVDLTAEMDYDLRWVEPPAPGEPENCSRYTISYNRMGVTETLMRLIGMVAPVDEPPMPSPSDFGLTDKPLFYAEDGGLIEYPLETPEGRHQLALATVKTADSGGVIPAFKIARHTGCCVTSEEIARALAAHDARLDGWPTPRELIVPVSEKFGWGIDAVPVDWWGGWIDWLREAAQHGGFTVN